MPTQAVVSVVCLDSSVRSIYVDFDGYLEGVGTTLNRFYGTTELAHRLVNLGNLSSIYETIEETESISNRVDYDFASNSTPIPLVFDSLSDFMYSPPTSKFNYLFIDGHWHHVPTLDQLSKQIGHTILGWMTTDNELTTRLSYPLDPFNEESLSGKVMTLNELQKLNNTYVLVEEDRVVGDDDDTELEYYLVMRKVVNIEFN